MVPVGLTAERPALSTSERDTDPLAVAFLTVPGPPPAYGLSRSRFEAFVAARAGRSLAGVHLDDLLLACACLEGLAPALRRFDEQYLSGIGRHLAGLGLSAAAEADVRQTLAEKLLVPRGTRPPRLADYHGRAPLGAWIAVVARRTAVSLLRGGRSGESLGQRLVETLAAPAGKDSMIDGPRQRRIVETALRTAIDSLGTRERLLLGLRFVKGLSNQAIGVMFRVDASTASRWISAARAAVLEAIERDLAVVCGRNPQLLRSLVGDVASQVDASLSRLLAG